MKAEDSLESQIIISNYNTMKEQDTIFMRNDENTPEIKNFSDERIIQPALNFDTENQDKPPIPPPIPARLNKPIPIIPERPNVPLIPERKLSTTSTATNEGMEKVEIKIPPPPQKNTIGKRKIFKMSENSENFEKKNTIEGNNVCYSIRENCLTDSDTKDIPLLHKAVFNRNQRNNNMKEESSYFTFPRVTNDSPSSEPNCADSQNHGYETFSHIRRKKGNKVPSPIKTCSTIPMDDSLDSPHFNNNTSCRPNPRQDSSLSCSDGGMSQNSSPSYIVRSLESPLLPKTNKHTTTGRNCKKSYDRSKLFSEMHEFSRKNTEIDSTLELSKSQSTPAGLQQIVDFQQRSSRQYQSKVIKYDNEKTSTHGYFTLRSQILNIIINAIVLLVIAAGIAIYYRAYPITTTTVHYINRTIIHNITHRPHSYYQDFDVYPLKQHNYYCTPFLARFCLIHEVPYNYSVFPNYFGLQNERDAESELELYSAIANVRCYQLAPLYLCSLYFPKCGAQGRLVLPCRNLCLEMNRRCGIFLEVFGIQLPEKIDCLQLPLSDNSEICVGYHEVKQHEIQERFVVCSDGFKCDERRCIPADWRCDGHIDCEDETDELNCTQCPGQLHCGMGQCIATGHICDGVINCPWGQDERNCLRLSERMGDVGYGNVEIFIPSEKAFRTACVTTWQSQHTASLMCDLLGYEHSKYYSLLYGKGQLYPVERFHVNSIKYLSDKSTLFEELRSCRNTSIHPYIRTTCSTYHCGIRKQLLAVRSYRIVGGVQSNPGEWPFIAAILGGPKEIFYCAGVLISDQWVLSAAHCVGNFNLSYPPVEWTIQLGMSRRYSHSYFGQKLKVHKVIPHPNYNQGISHDNDIALFQLKERVKFHDHLQPVCMPPATEILKPPRNCTVIGWGKTIDSDVSEYEPTVYEVEVPILSRNLCNKWLQRRDLKVTSGMICAGYEHGGKDACQGDSGGPLLCRSTYNPDRWFVGGIVSWGVKCAHPHLPGIYANVPKFVPWIEEQMEKNNY